jgi:hypothetical protein
MRKTSFHQKKLYVVVVGIALVVVVLGYVAYRFFIKEGLTEEEEVTVIKKRIRSLGSQSIPKDSQPKFKKLLEQASTETSLTILKQKETDIQEFIDRENREARKKARK